MNKPVVFMDFDGVLNFFASRTAYRKYGDTLGHIRRGDAPYRGSWYRLNWSAELVQKLMELRRETGYKWVWLTTWTGDTETLDTILKIASDDAVVWDAYPKGLANDDAVYAYRHATKLKAVLDFAAANPDTPIVWVDDEATALWTEAHAAAMTAPFLILTPSETYGMVRHDLHKLTVFIQANS